MFLPPPLQWCLLVSGSCVSLIIQGSLKTPIQRHLPPSYCTYKNNCVRVSVCVRVRRDGEEITEGAAGRWDKNGGHNRGKKETQNQFRMHSFCKCFYLYGRMLAASTERCTPSLSYLLVQLIFSVPSEAAVHWFLHTHPKCQRQNVFANPVTKWKFETWHWGGVSFCSCSPSELLILDPMPQFQ